MAETACKLFEEAGTVVIVKKKLKDQRGGRDYCFPIQSEIDPLASSDS